MPLRCLHPTSLLKSHPDQSLQTSHQEGAEHVEADEVVVGKVGATRILLPGRIVRLWVTQLPIAAGQQDLLPCFPGGTPEQRRDAVGLCRFAGSPGTASGMNRTGLLPEVGSPQAWSQCPLLAVSPLLPPPLPF